MSGGDIGSFSQLFFDNVSTVLATVFAIRYMESFGVSSELIKQTIYGKIVPGVGIMLVIGNVYYGLQAIRLSMKWGRPYTAQPYGINTPAAFAFIYNILYTVYFENSTEIGPDDAFVRAYKVTLAANFITGVIATFIGLFGPLMLSLIPPAALLVPIAAIGISFLGLEQLTNCIAAPLVGYSTLMWVFLGWYSGVKVGWGRFRIPEACMVIIVGIVLGWCTGLNQVQDVKDSLEDIKWWGPDFTADDLFRDFNLAGDYISIIIPLGIAASSSTLMCLVSAKEAGDPFPVRETMITDGIGTMLSACFGSPFGSVVYIGHPAYKRSGATVGYSFMNGFIFVILSLFGVLSLLQSIVNAATIGPIVFLVGLMINEEVLNFIPSRHYPAYIIGLFPSIYDWVTNISGTAPMSDSDATHNMSFPSDSLGFIGVLGWKRGALVVSMVWTAIVVSVLDRKWINASIWAVIGAAFAVCGIIHVPEAGVEDVNEPLWEQCRVDEDEGSDDDVVCWIHATQFKFFGAYLVLLGWFLVIEFARLIGSDVGGPIDDPTAHAFDDWFKDAGRGPVDEEFVEPAVKSTIDEEKEITPPKPDEGDAEGQPSPPAATTPSKPDKDDADEHPQSPPAMT